jgi:hypothetical protein
LGWLSCISQYTSFSKAAYSATHAAGQHGRHGKIHLQHLTNQHARHAGLVVPRGSHLGLVPHSVCLSRLSCLVTATVTAILQPYGRCNDRCIY